MNKKEQLDQAAWNLFWKHGFQKVSITEICQKAKLSRKTFYAYYKDKTTLILHLLEDWNETLMQSYRSIIENEQPFADKMQKLLALKYEMSGNFSMEFVADFFNPQAAAILEQFSKMTANSLETTKNFFIQAQNKGELNPNLQIDFLMWLIQKQLELFRSDEIMHLFPDAETLARQFSESLIYGILPHNNENR
ncbi:MAG: TetR/AcrR family transcriptional regulator [Bacteroidales bacterium]|nr:TetR/AcrR family transcriptional regulator [Bacteroidales bacterium]